MLARRDFLPIIPQEEMGKDLLEKERREYARFLKKESLAQGFSYHLDDVRHFRTFCPRGYKQIKVEEDNKAENSLKFYYSPSRCQLCEKLQECSIEKDRFLVKAEFLSLLGMGFFYRRIQSKTISKGIYDKEMVQDLPCYAGWTYTRILSNGVVIPCCKGTGLPMGNVRESSFKEIWYSPKYQEFRKRARHGPPAGPSFASLDCFRVCDNLGSNTRLHHTLLSLNPLEKLGLWLTGFFLRGK